MQLPATQVITAPVRLAFPSLAKMRQRAVNSDKLTYQATFLMPPDFDLAPLHNAMRAAFGLKFPAGTKIPPDKLPIRDAGAKEWAGFVAGWRYISTHADRPIGVVDQYAQPVPADARDVLFYGGCWVRAHLNAYGWSHQTGGKGISFGLVGVQFVRDDDRFDGRSPAGDAFEPLADLPQNLAQSDDALPF